MKLCILCLIFWFISIYALPSDFKTSTKCYSYNETACNNSNNSGSDCESIIDCDSTDKSHCYVLWANNTENGTLALRLKGCFILSGKDCDGENRCVAREEKNEIGLLFCCCKESYCNKHFFWDPTPAPPTTKVTAIPEAENSATYLVYGLFPLSMVLLVVIMFMLKNKKFPYFGHFSSYDHPRRRPHASSAPVLEKLHSLQLIEIKARGKFGAVWKASAKNEIVAVKIMPIQEKKSWLTEQEVYGFPSISHENILRFIGSQKHGDGLHMEYWLVTAYHEYGSLYDFLKSHTVSWEQLCHIMYSMAKGLTFLHEEIQSEKEERYKPAIAHRDFKSSNVLLKNDLTACIADFGLALVFWPSKSRHETHGQVTVGTRRYMAPEVLEGAINFSRDSFLRIDMYAFGLVLWELATRCSLQQNPVPEYKLPFEEEIGQHPSLEDIQETVVHKKKRPIVKNNWRQHGGFGLVSDTIEECWDHDAEARLSASCVMERIAGYAKPAITSRTSLMYNDTATSMANNNVPANVIYSTYLTTKPT